VAGTARSRHPADSWSRTCTTLSLVAATENCSLCRQLDLDADRSGLSLDFAAMETPIVLESVVSAERQSGPGFRDTAWADTDALVGIFSCTSEAMGAELARSQPDVPLGGLARSWVHEHTHLYHAISTPFGIFCSAVRTVQLLATRDVLALLRSAGVPRRLPLLRHVLKADSATIASIREPLTVWLDAELFMTYLLGSVAAYESLAATYPVTSGTSMAGIFPRLQLGIARYLLGDSAPEVLDALVDEDLMFPERWREEDRASFMNAMISPQPSSRVFGTSAVLESAAHAVEMWGESFASFERLYAARHQDLNYLYPIARTASELRSRSLPEILGTHLAVCDLALAAPIMPDRVVVRHGLQVDEMLPHLRLLSIQNALETVGPLRGPHEYSAFTDAVSEYLHWTRPEEVFASADSEWLVRLAIRGQAFRLAADLRQTEPSIFATPFLSYDTEMQGFRKLFTFHTLEFTDRAIHQGNADWRYHSKLEFVCKEWLHGVMVGTPKTVVVPWRANAEEIATLIEDAQEVFSTALGSEVQPPRVTSAR
jgi:hypothetical protein